MLAMEIEQDVVIVGAGVAGLATAVGLMRIGVRCLVLEKSNVLRTTGAAFTLTPNAWRALDALGVSHKLDVMYTPLLKSSVTTVSNGNVQEFPLGKAGNGPRTVHRSVLQEVLAGELPMDIIRFSSKLKSIEIVQHEGSTLAVLSLEDGMIIKAKVVIGCDGVHSVVAQWLGLNPPVDSGRSAVRGLSVFPQGHELKHEVVQFVDGVTRSGYVPLNDKEIYWFALTNINSKDVDMKSKEPESIQKMILDTMPHFPTKFIDVVNHSKLSSLSWAPFMLRLPWELLLKDVCKHNITVAGDAMHPMTPELAQGAGSALEDAVVLCRHIGSSLVQNGKIDSRALKGYVKERRWRAAMLISGSYLSGWIQQPGSGISGWLKAFFTKRVFYKYFPLATANVVSYDCGKLPTVFGEENTRSKSE